MSQDGFTALAAASCMGNLGVVEALLAAGADKEAKDYVGDRCLEFTMGHTGI